MALPQIKSGIGRPMDFRYPSNVFAVGITAASGIGFGSAVAFAGWSPWRALAATLGVFIAWAIGRELDPGRTVTGGLAALAAILIAVLGAPVLLAVFATLIVVRSVVGSVGLELQPLDLVVIGIVGWASGGDLWLWPIGLWMLGFLLLAPEAGRYRYFAVAILAIPFVAAWYASDVSPLTLDLASVVGAAVALVAGIVSLAVVDCDESSDLRPSPITHLRVRLGRVAAATVVAAAFLGLGGDALWIVGPVAAAIGAIVVTSVTVPVWRRFSHSRTPSEPTTD